MTGAEFKAALKAAGYTQAAFALVMGVHRETVGNQCQAAQVERYWVYALAGLVAASSASAVVAIVGNIDG
ncbi:helix-turn-helix transcriptional regulator [Janthinobacterium sp. CAN_S7]|uniref:helix-turn-helix transcriptional regulator n=1 Tax=Janthinobacterium sp. CAN_S7 TaxID=3071704 RepID=UPI00319E0CDD